MEFLEPYIGRAAHFSPIAFYERQRNFKWDKEALPLAQDHWLVIAPALYLSGVFLLRAIVPEGGIPLGSLPTIHNAVLVLWCALLQASECIPLRQ